MKKVSLILTGALAFAALATAPACQENAANKQEGTTQSPAASAKEIPAGAIVYVQIDTLLSKFDFFNDLQAELEAKAQAVSDDLNKKGRSFEKDVNDFQTKVQKGLITRSQAEAQQQQLATRQQELENYSQQKQMELAEERQVMMNRVLDAIKTFLKNYNQIHEYAMIITTDGNSNTVIEASAELDITADVVAGLNKEYATNQNK